MPLLDLLPVRRRISIMTKLRQIFVCATPGEGRCGAKGGGELLAEVTAEVERRGIAP